MDQYHRLSDASADSSISDHSMNVSPGVIRIVFLVNDTDGDPYVVKQMNSRDGEELDSVRKEVEILKTLNFGYIVTYVNSFEDKEAGRIYIVMEYCEGGDLSKVMETRKEERFFEEKEASFFDIWSLGWLLHDLCMLDVWGGLPWFGDLPTTQPAHQECPGAPAGQYMRIELRTETEPMGEETESNGRQGDGCQRWSQKDEGAWWSRQNDGKSQRDGTSSWKRGREIHLLGGSWQPQDPRLIHIGSLWGFGSGTMADGIQRHIVHAVSMAGNPPHVSEKYSVELRELIRQMLSCDPKDRPSAEEILAKPFLNDAVNRNSRTPEALLQSVVKSIDTFDKAYNKHFKDIGDLVSEWGRITDSMESAHYSATAGSLSGSVIGAAGGITALVGLILAPFTLGASLIVTGVGVGVGVAGGVTGAASTITNTVQQKSYRESLEQIQQKYNSVSEPILTPLNTLRKVLRKIAKFNVFFGNSAFDNVQISCNLNKRNVFCAIQLMNLGLLANVSRIATQTARVGRVVAEAVSGVLSGLLVIVDVAFIVMDSVDIHQMRQGKVDDPEKVKSSLLKSIAEMRRTHNELCNVQREIQTTREELKAYIELSLFFTACGIIRLGEFGEINERSTDAHTTETEALAYVAPEILNGEPYYEKTEMWQLGCVVYELCKLKCAFMARNAVEIVGRILACSYEALPNTFSEDLRQLVKDTLQKDPGNRPSVSQILTRPFIIKHLHKMPVHFNTTVSSLTGGVVGLAGGITSLVGLILAPFTLGASLIVTGVGIGTAVAGGITAGASNITNMVNQQTNRQKIKMIITEFQEKITSIICCIQNISTAVETLENEFSTSNGSLSNTQSGMSVGARLGRGLGGIPELLRLTQVVNIGKIAAQAARAVRVAETVTGVLSAFFVAVDVFFVFLDSREIHNIRRDYALKSTRQESTSNQTTGLNDRTSNNRDTTNLLPSNNQQAEELKSETMKFVTKIKDTTEELQTILDALRDTLNPNSETQNTDNYE
ncbi:putative serine/threonine-protein kinase nek3 [Labeo rohita]|uniref:Serine/threonine-protein kinase nek3 n=1 Tax=Labeo rohita TaxID=84645 RepID=A0ABQ8LA47_LABRO|nr:putative serine/threonine-protein kinase nek3 [Labeo rohita]